MGKASSAKKIQRVQRAGVSRSPGQRRALGFPATVIGIIIVGAVLVAFARDARIEAGTEAPAANVDHWHAALGVYECDKFLGDVPDPGSDPTGIHTHADGLIHIHPFGAASAGRNATFGKFAETVGITIEEGLVTMPVAMGGQELKDGGTCTNADGKEEKAELMLLVWPPQATSNVDPDVITSDLGSIRFTEDGQIMVLALLPESMDPNDVPLPPSIEQLKNPLEAEGGGTPEPIPAEELPTDLVPTDSVPTESVPTESVPAESVPADTTPPTAAPGS